MAPSDKVLQQILGGSSDANIRFADLRSLLLRLAFEERVRGFITFIGRREWRRS